MNCNEARKYIYPLLDNELDTKQNVEVLNHLNMCDQCQEKFETERAYLEDLSTHLSNREAPETLEEQIREMAGEARKSRSRLDQIRNKLKSIAPAASAAIFLFALLSLAVFSLYIKRDTEPSEAVRYMPELHSRVKHQTIKNINKNPDEFSEIRPEELKERYRDEIKLISRDVSIPSLEKYSCKILDGKAEPSGVGALVDPLFYALYCIPKKESDGHNFMTYVVMKRSWFSPEQLKLSDKTVSTSGDFTLISDRKSKNNMIYWGNNEYVCVFVSSDMNKDQLLQLSRTARKQEKKLDTDVSNR